MPRATIDRFEQRKATRAKLIDAALKLFSTSGYEHATVDDISEAAGYSKGAYYFHFSTKDDILLELLRVWTESRSTALTAAAAGGEGAVEDLGAMLEGLYSYDETPQWPGVLLEFWSQGMRNTEINKRVTQAYTGWRRQLTEAFAAAGASGDLRIDSADDAASVALAAHDGYAVQLAIGSPGARAMTAAELTNSLLTPLQTASEERGRRAAAI